MLRRNRLLPRASFILFLIPRIYKIITAAIERLTFLAFYKLNSDFGSLMLAEELVSKRFSSSETKEVVSCINLHCFF